MSSQEKKRKTTTPTKKQSPVPTPIPSLPNDLLLNCFARVSRLYYPTVSLVSKSFRSFLASPELYQTRLLLGRTECSLYVCLRYGLDCKPCWFTLCRKPNQTLTNGTKKSSRYVLARIPIPDSPESHQAGLVSVGCNIYTIGNGEPIKYVPTHNVSILDCWSHTWRKAPSMQVERNYPVANVFDGNIYVAGGCKSSSNWEVFDTKTQTWKHLINPLAEHCNSHISKSAVVAGEIYMFGNRNDYVAYNPKERRWRVSFNVDNLRLGCSWLSYCVINDVLYCYSQLHEIKWHDFKVRDWVKLKGLEGLPKFDFYGLVKLVDYGGKMAVFWDNDVSSSGDENIVIWCAVIVLERRSTEEIWGEVVWCEEVLTVPKSYGFVNALAVTV